MTFYREVIHSTKSIKDIFEAGDGKEALDLVAASTKEQLPDLVLLDRNMPRMNGDEFIRIFKADPFWGHIPVLFLTTHGEIEELVKDNSDMNYIDAIIHFCDQSSIDLESVPKLITKPLKEKLKYEAMELNFLRRNSRAKLPL